MNHSETVIKERRRKRLQIVLAIGIAGSLITVCGVAFLNNRFSRPAGTGVSNGRLADCPDSPNCVTSFDAEASRAMQPFQFNGTPDLAWRHLLDVVSTMQRCDVVLYDKLIGDGIMSLVRRDAERIFVGKQASNHAMRQEEIQNLGDQRLGGLGVGRLGRAQDLRPEGDALDQREELARCHETGIPFLVIHPGSYRDSSLEQGIARIAEAINRTYAEHPEYTVITLLENTAGQGNTIGRTFEELAQIGATEAEARARHGDRLSVARFDLAHVDRAIADHLAQRARLLDAAFDKALPAEPRVHRHHADQINHVEQFGHGLCRGAGLERTDRRRTSHPDSGRPADGQRGLRDSSRA